MRCKRCGWREMLLEIWRATHPDPHPPPNTIGAKIARELGVTETDMRRRRDGQSGAPNSTPASSPKYRR